jgi:hypothetical protein
MVGRLRDPKGIDYPFKTIEKDPGEINDITSSKKIKKEFYEDLMRKYFLIEATKDDLKSIEIGAPRDIEENFKGKMKLARLKAYTYVGDIGTLYKTPGDLVVKNPAEVLNILGWYDEIYQAYHRNRGLIKDNRRIFSYGWFPEPKALMFLNEKEIGELSQFEHSLRDEFGGNIEKVPEENEEEFFNNLLKYNKDGLIDDMIAFRNQHPDIPPSEIADLFRNYKRGKIRGVDTKSVTWLFKCIDTIKAQAKYPEKYPE